MNTGRILFILFSCSVLIGISEHYARHLPHAPDEGNHLQMIEHYAENLRLATWKDTQYGTFRGHAYHLFPPGGYLPYIPFVWLAKIVLPEAMPEGTIDPDTVRYIERLGGGLIGILQYLVSLLICARLFPVKTAAYIAAFSINLWPHLRYLHGYVNTDAVAILAGTFGGYVLLRLFEENQLSLRTSFLASAAVGIIALSKYNVFVIAAGVFIVYLIQLVCHNVSYQNKWRHLGLFLCGPIVLSSWFYFHVYYELSNGHVLASEEHMQLLRSTFKGTIGKLPTGEFSVTDLQTLVSRRINELPWTLRTAFGAPWRYSRLPDWLLSFVFSVAGLASIGWLLCIKTTALCPVEQRYRKFILFGVFLFFCTYFTLALEPRLKIQGRLLLPSLVPVCLFLIFGLLALFRFIFRNRLLSSTAATSVFLALFILGNLYGLKVF